MSLLAAPGVLWTLYVDYLCNYAPGSWVYKTASTFRVLAVATILPFVLLTLLDVTSYVIARTLGVIDDTKAATSAPEPEPEPAAEAPPIVVQPAPQAAPLAMMTPPATYFRNPLEEEGNLRLSGVGMFSPAPSQPPSPTLARRELGAHAHAHGTAEADGEGVRRVPSRDSSSGEESFAMLDRESGSEDAQHSSRPDHPSQKPEASPADHAGL
ncbi:hypothetical protein WOLCODRAFT_164590 [Wolfiporia cocos MD-104 SS10]|uniref:Uncharacterized protein n=1 Tax=Wolfiporia cocos (strain MD-104) TaxID=742152 RepID=A0A2H3JXJ0_WOLCO|nr:hypothetical protein WOLCODRAFT_164590 [Wolfiporia cocos MD-104 SS10]